MWRAQGLSYRKISEAWLDETGEKISHATVSNDIAGELEKIAVLSRSEAEHYREMELMRLDMAMSAIAAKVSKGQVDAVREWVKISESRRKLLGIDAPVQLQVAQHREADQEEFISLLEASLDDETFAKVAEAASNIAQAYAAAEAN